MDDSMELCEVILAVEITEAQKQCNKWAASILNTNGQVDKTHVDMYMIYYMNLLQFYRKPVQIHDDQ